MNQGRIIVITGAPGTGKTTTASVAGERKQLSLRGQRAALRPGRVWTPGHCGLLLP